MEPDRPSVYTGPLWKPVWNRSKTGPNFLYVQFWIHLDSFWTGSRMVPCKQKLIWSSSVQNGSGRSHVNIALERSAVKH